MPKNTHTDIEKRYRDYEGKIKKLRASRIRFATQADMDKALRGVDLPSPPVKRDRTLEVMNYVGGAVLALILSPLLIPVVIYIGIASLVNKLKRRES